MFKSSQESLKVRDHKHKLPLVDVLRPQSLEDIALPKKTKDIITNYLKEPGSMPHLRFFGPAGTGKTSLAKIIIKTILKETEEFNSVSFNASDQRGIEVIRQIREYVKTKPYNIEDLEVPYKIVFLDECDQLTDSAQHALRCVISENSSRARFILSCNYDKNITVELKSRTLGIPFDPLSEQELFHKTRDVLKKHKIEYDPEHLWFLCTSSKGDFRFVYNNITNPKEELVNFELDVEIEAIISNMLNLDTTMSLESIISKIQFITNNHKYKDLIFNEILKTIEKKKQKISQSCLFFIIDRLSRAQMCIKLGGDIYLQILGWFSSCRLNLESLR